MLVTISGCKIERVAEHQQAIQSAEQGKIEDATEDQARIETEESAETKEAKEQEHPNVDASQQEEKSKEAQGSATNGSQSQQEEKQPSTTPKQEIDPMPAKQYVTISIDVKTILSNMQKLQENKQAYVPADGYLLAPMKVAIQEGDTVYSILQRVTRSHRIHMEVQGSGSSVYVQGIGQLYEFDCGNLSGWMYRLNHAFVSVGAGAKLVQDGDVIEWKYSCDSGRDLDFS